MQGGGFSVLSYVQFLDLRFVVERKPHIAQAFGGGLGFWFALTIMAGVRSKLQDQSRIPKSFQGVPIVLTTASILSLAFLGFQGLFG